MKSENDECLKIVLFPWLAHGHITSFLELAKGLCDRNFICYICSTPINLTSIHNRIPPKYSSRIHLLPLHLPPTPQLPPHHHTTNNIPIGLHGALKKALKAAKPIIADMVSSAQPDLLIYDVILPWAAAATAAPAVAFHVSGAAGLSCFYHLVKRDGTEFPFADTLLKGFDLSAAFGHVEYEREESDDDDDQTLKKRSGLLLVSSCREMEGQKYLDYLSQQVNKKVEAIGAFTHDSYNDDLDTDDDAAEIMGWLDEKEENSSVYVSFGSEYFLNKDEIEAIANGLELSNVNFIWVIRFPKGKEMKVEEALPRGFLERVRERGKIVEWAPQTKILGHRSIGGFVSHCGWNSFKESLYFGVPIIAMPMHYEQPVHANLMVELGVGVHVKRDDDGKFVKEEISSVIRDVVVGETKEALRRRVGEAREKAIERSREEMDGVAHLLAELCGKSSNAL